MAGFEEELERSRIRDEEVAKLRAIMAENMDRDRVMRGLVIALVVYGSAGLVLVSAAAGLAVRIFLWASGL